jgi:hypothetical protein
MGRLCRSRGPGAVSQCLSRQKEKVGKVRYERDSQSSSGDQSESSGIRKPRKMAVAE